MDESKLDLLNDIWKQYINEPLSVQYTMILRPLVKKYDLPLLLDSLEASLSQYLEFNKDSTVKTESLSKVVEYVEKIARHKKKLDQNPHLKQLYYARGILKNRFKGYFDARRVIIQLEKAYKEGASTEELIELCKVSKNWTEFRDATDRYVKGSVSMETVIAELISHD